MSSTSRRAIWAWAFYDWANSAFATTVMAGFFPVFFKQYWSTGADVTVSTDRLGFANGLAGLLISIISPVLGAIADRGGTRVRLLALFTLLGALATGGMFWVAQGDWPFAVALYVLGSCGFSGGVTFNDALLPDLVAKGPRQGTELDRVSALGYSMGYLGGGLLFALNVAMTLQPALFGLADAAQAVRWSFVSVAVWWVLFSLPLLLWVREPATAKGGAAAVGQGDGATHEGSGTVVAALRALRGTLRSLPRSRGMVTFLLAYWLYIDGVNTVIKMAVDYGLALGFPSSSLITALLLTQFVGFPAAIAFGWLGRRLGPRTAIQLAIGVYVLTTLYAYQMSSATEFYALAVAVGLVQGGIQSLSRSFFARLVPPERAGELFGLFNLVGKFGAVLGPLLTGRVAVLTHSSRLSILSLLVLFVAGSVLLQRVPPPEVAST